MNISLYLVGFFMQKENLKVCISSSDFIYAQKRNIQTKIYINNY